jgi:signal transduction histidine kinase
MHRSSLPSAAATAILPLLDAPSPLPTRGSPANHELVPADGGAAASMELTQYLTQEHDRIAQGMNDVVVRRIFAAGLDLQAALGLIGDRSAASKIWHAIDELDQAIRDIRNTIFDWQQGHTRAAHQQHTASIAHRQGSTGGDDYNAPHAEPT